MNILAFVPIGNNDKMKIGKLKSKPPFVTIYVLNRNPPPCYS